MANGKHESSKTVISVGDRVRIQCGPDPAAHAAHRWEMLFDGEPVEGLVDVYLFGEASDLGLRSAVFHRHREPNADAVNELRLAGWSVAIVDAVSEPGPTLRAAVLDPDGAEVSYRERSSAPEARVEAARQAAHAAYFWHSPETRSGQEKARES